MLNPIEKFKVAILHLNRDCTQNIGARKLAKNLSTLSQKPVGLTRFQQIYISWNHGHLEFHMVLFVCYIFPREGPEHWREKLIKQILVFFQFSTWGATIFYLFVKVYFLGQNVDF